MIIMIITMFTIPIMIIIMFTCTANAPDHKQSLHLESSDCNRPRPSVIIGLRDDDDNKLIIHY